MRTRVSRRAGTADTQGTSKLRSRRPVRCPSSRTLGTESASARLKRSQAACRPPYSPVSNLTTTDNLVLKVFGKGQKERLVPFSPELRRRVSSPPCGLTMFDEVAAVTR
jgi:hypothetical protein